MAAVVGGNLHPLQVGLELATADAGDLCTDATQVLLLAARRDLVADLCALTAYAALPSHRSPRLA